MKNAEISMKTTMLMLNKIRECSILLNAMLVNTSNEALVC